MGESHFLKILASFYAFPILMMVVFAFLIFWLCRIFQNNAITRFPDGHAQQPLARPQVPPRQIPLRTLAAIALFIIFGHFGDSNGVRAADIGVNRSCVPEFRSRMKQLGFTLKKCTKNSVSFGTIVGSLCNDWSFNPSEECYTLKDLYPIFFLLILLVLMLAVTILFFRNKLQKTSQAPPPEN